MAIVLEMTKHLLHVNAAVLALFLFGPGLAPPSQSSAGPASTCEAPFWFYQRVALFHHLFLICVLASCYLACIVVCSLAAAEGASMAAMDAATRLRMRATLLCAIALSAAATVLALSVYTFILQIRYSVLACMPTGVRYLLYAADAVVGVVCAYTYGFFVWSAIFGV